MTVLPPPALPTTLPTPSVERLLALMAKKLSFGDALVLATIEAWIPHAACFISWDAGHIRGKTDLPVKTPKEFLAEVKEGVANLPTSDSLSPAGKRGESRR